MNVSSLYQHFSVSPRTWGSKQISQWLELLNMNEYQEVFENNKIDGLIIFDLEDNEMEEILGVKNSIHRKRFRNGINILRQFQTEFEKLNQKIANADGTNYDQNNIPPLSTSVMNSQQARVMSFKNNHYLQFNSQTAQRRELENVFNVNALTSYDPEMNHPEYKNHPPLNDQALEENKDVEDSLFYDDDALFNRKDKMKNRAYQPEKPFDHQQKPRETASPTPAVQVLKRLDCDFSDKSSPKKLKKSASLKSDSFHSPLQDFAERSPVQGGSLNQLEACRGSHQKPRFNNNPAELIIHPIDMNHANNFYRISETGGRIGRHSNNEIVILEESVSRYHSVIEYKENKFYLLDIGSTTGTFVKITTPLILEENMILELGSNQFLVERIIIQDSDHGILYLKVIEGLHAEREFVIENNATIGRKGQFSPTTIALIDDLHLSNTHTKISFSDSKFIVEDLGSTNGSWLRMSAEGEKSRPFELLDGMIFKVGASSTFRAKIHQDSVQNGDDGNCAVCNENERDVVLLPCKHNVSCVKCSKSIKQCPVCRFKVTDVIRIYKS